MATRCGGRSSERRLVLHVSVDAAIVDGRRASYDAAIELAFGISEGACGWPPDSEGVLEWWQDGNCGANGGRRGETRVRAPALENDC